MVLISSVLTTRISEWQHHPVLIARSVVWMEGERNLLDVPALLQRHLGQSRGALGFRHAGENRERC